VNLKKGCPGLAPCPEGQTTQWPSVMTALQIREKRDLPGKQQARQLHSICVGGSLWAIWMPMQAH